MKHTFSNPFFFAFFFC
nr:hypothetical protein [Nostoc sp. MS1]